MSENWRTQISETNVIRRHYVVNNPEIVRISTIKPKHVDEIRFMSFKEGEQMLETSFEILGTYGGYIIGMLDDGRLRKISRGDYIMNYMAETGDKDVSRVNRIVDLFPELFSA